MIPETTRIGDPMNYQQALDWLLTEDTPAGQCTVTRARRILAWATDAGAVHLTCGPDLLAPGRILAWDGDHFEQFSPPYRPTTPFNVARSMTVKGYVMAGPGKTGWVTVWGGAQAVRVSKKGTFPYELEALTRNLQIHGWTVELRNDTLGLWLLVSQPESDDL